MAGQKPEPSTKAMVATASGIIALLGLVGWLSVMDIRQTNEAQAALCGNKAGAWGWAKVAVQERLKAPSTAEFPWFDEAFVSTDGECGYVVHAHVDAENSFGAQIRSRFVVALEHVPESGGYRIDRVAVQ